MGIAADITIIRDVCHCKPIIDDPIPQSKAIYADNVNEYQYILVYLERLYKSG